MVRAYVSVRSNRASPGPPYRASTRSTSPTSRQSACQYPRCVTRRRCPPCSNVTVEIRHSPQHEQTRRREADTFRTYVGFGTLLG